MIGLNEAQSKGLANFFFDLAKGLVLGSLGLSFTIPGSVRMTIMTVALILAGYCVRLALRLLEEINDF